MKTGEFKLEASDGRARAGTLMTAHGAIETPVFMLVGTKASVKSLDPQVVEDLGAEVILGNTYHLYLSPGEKLIQEMGGLHNFMHWGLPILTDSGGFQVFSLGMGKKNHTRGRHSESREESSKKILRGAQDDNVVDIIPEAKITEEGVEFRSHKDGSTHFFTPEKSIEIQAALGADIIMAFDECPPYPSTEQYYQESMNRTHRWLERCITKKKELENSHLTLTLSPQAERGSKEEIAPSLPLLLKERGGVRFYKQNTPKDQLLFGIVQGGISEKLRKESAQFVAGQNLPGIAIGGVANGGESRGEMMQQVEWAVEELPSNKPRYLMGVGTPLDLVEFVARGIDMFDCVLPTRLGRNGAFWMTEVNPSISHSESREESSKKILRGAQDDKLKGARAQIKNSRFKNDPRPLMEGCTCSTCTRFTRAYIHHLFIEDEPLGMQLLSIHNIHTLINEMVQIRQAILEKRFAQYYKTTKQVWT